MAKYYVCTGNFQCMVEGEGAKEAALRAFEQLPRSNAPSLGSVTLVSQYGFASLAPDDLWFSTLTLLEQSGQFANYQHKDHF